MPIDPNIALGIKPVQLNDPLEQYNRMLNAQGQMRQNALADLQMGEARHKQGSRNALALALRAGLNPDGTIDLAKSKAALAGTEYADQLADLEEFGWKHQKAGAEIANLGLQGKKTEAEIEGVGLTNDKTFAATVAERLKIASEGLPGVTTPEQYLAWEAGNFQDPVLAKYAASRGDSFEKTKADVAAVVARGPEAFQAWLNEKKLGSEKFLQRHFVDQTGDGFKRTVSMPAYVGGPATEVAGTRISYTPERHTAKTNTTITVGDKVETEYGKRFAGLVADSDEALRKAATGAPRAAERADRILTLLSDPKKVIVGSGDEFRLGFAKALGLVGASDAETIANTEQLAAELAQSTIESFQALGVGARGIDTPAERKFLEKMTGSPSLDRESLIRLTKLARKTAERAASAWNTRAKSVPASAVQGTGISLEPVQLPSVPAAPASTAPKQKTPVGPVPGINAPPRHIEALRQNRTNPKAVADFDKKYGTGAAKRVLGGN